LSGRAFIYSPSLSNADVWLLAVLKFVVLSCLLAFTPGSSHASRRRVTDHRHKQMNLGADITCSLAACLLLAKSVCVAVSAPDAVLPRPLQPGNKPFVGLAYMFASILACLIATPCQYLSSVKLIGVWQQQLEAARAAARDSETAPLLGSTEGQQEAASQGAPGFEGDAGSSSRPATSTTPGTSNTSNQTVRFLLRLSLPDVHIMMAAFSAGAVAALAAALIPYYSGLIIDYASIDPDRPKFVSTIIRLVVVAALCGLFTGIRGGLFTVVMANLKMRLRTRLFHSLMQMEVGFFDTTKTGDITSRLSADTATVSEQIGLNVNVMMRSATQAALVVGFMARASWRLTIVTFIVVPFITIISKVYGAYFSKLSKVVQTSLAEANSMAEEVLSSMTTVKAHAAQYSAEKDYSDKLQSYYSLQMREARAYLGYAASTTFLPTAVSAVVLYFGGMLVLDGMMSPGSLVSFMLYQQTLSFTFQSIGDVFSCLMTAVGAADKVVELMNRKPGINPGSGFIPPSFSGKVELREVVLRYPARPHITVLAGLSFVIKPGEVVALVGSSGGGKSSVVKLLERFYLPQSGQVLLDDRDIGQYDDRWLRRQVALVSQEPTLYGRSIKRNILYGMEELSDAPGQEEVEEAARQANAHAFITSFPDGYETNCGEKGLQLSGGQKQRIAIARALVRKPRVLLLDEATSALDADSEAVVQEALDRMMQHRTTLIIAHRLSTVQNADRIIVISHGTVQEIGTHESLVEKGGTYAALVRRQLHCSHSSAGLLQSVSHLNQQGSSASLVQLEDT